MLMGGKGSKKSTTTALNMIYRLLKYKNSNLLVVRAYMNTHRDSTFAQLLWAQEMLGVSDLFKNTVSPMEMTLKNTGQKIIFRGFDDVMKLASATVPKGSLNFVWIEEAFELAREEDFDTLDLSVPRGKVDGNLFKQTTLTFNPWSESHWLKKRFFDIKRNNVSVYKTNYLINEFLDPTDLAVFEKMKTENRRRYEVAGLGNWGIIGGLVFENWEEKEFVVPDNEEHLYKNYFGLDYGYTNDPTAFVAFRASYEKKIIYVFDEFYKKKMLNSEIANEIIRRGYKKERIRADCAEPKSNDELKRLGIVRIAPSLKGRDSILSGIAKLNEYKIYVHPSCKNMINELSSYVYDEKVRENGYIMPKDSNNHLCDALRYAVCDVAPSRDNIIRQKSNYSETILKGGPAG